MGDSDPEFAAVITEIFIDWKLKLTEVLSQARIAGELSIDLEPDILANHIVAIIEGGIMLARVSKDGSNLKLALDSLRCMLGIEDK